VLLTLQHAAQGLPNDLSVKADRSIALVDQIERGFAWDAAGRVDSFGLFWCLGAGEQAFFVTVIVQRREASDTGAGLQDTRMKIKIIFAAAAIGAMSTTAIAQNVTTPTGNIVMIEKNQGSLALLGLGGAGAAAVEIVVVAVVAASASAVGGSR
jgi:hypothetical protein